MKRTILILTAILAVNAASAQFFVKAGLGYNVSALSAPIHTDLYDTAGAVVGEQATRHSFGNGATITGAVGYDFNENLGFQLGAFYGLTTSPLETKTPYANGGDVSSTTKATGVLVLQPAFTLSSNSDRLNLYSRVGLSLPISGEIDNVNTVTPNNGSTFEGNWITKGKMSLGYNAALGFSFPLGNNLSFWGELNGNFLNVSGDTRTRVAYTRNDNDILAAQTFQQNNQIYSDEVLGTDNTNSTEAMKVIAEDAPFSSIGLAVGVKLSLGNGRKKRQEEN